MFGFIKSTQVTGSGVGLSITIPSVPRNTLVVISIKSTANITGISATDNASSPNTYALASGSVGAGTNFVSQLYGVAVTGGATSVTLSWTTSASVRVTVEQFSGGKQTNATVFDKVASNNATGTSSLVTLSPSAAGELIVANIGMTSGVSGVTIGSNYRAGTNNTSQTTEYRQVGTTSETAPLSWTGSTAWAEVAGAYIPLNVAANGAALM